MQPKQPGFFHCSHRNYVQRPHWFGRSRLGIYLYPQGNESISHLGERTIIDSIVPTGMGYVSSQEGKYRYLSNWHLWHLRVSSNLHFQQNFNLNEILKCQKPWFPKQNGRNLPVWSPPQKLRFHTRYESHLGKSSGESKCYSFPMGKMAEDWQGEPPRRVSVFSSWWFQPIWKICASQIGSFPQVEVKIKNIWNHHLVFVGFHVVGWWILHGQIVVHQFSILSFNSIQLPSKIKFQVPMTKQIYPSVSLKVSKRFVEKTGHVLVSRYPCYSWSHENTTLVLGTPNPIEPRRALLDPVGSPETGSASSGLPTKFLLPYGCFRK